MIKSFIYLLLIKWLLLANLEVTAQTDFIQPASWGDNVTQLQSTNSIITTAPSNTSSINHFNMSSSLPPSSPPPPADNISSSTVESSTISSSSRLHTDNATGNSISFELVSSLSASNTSDSTADSFRMEATPRPTAVAIPTVNVTQITVADTHISFIVVCDSQNMSGSAVNVNSSNGWNVSFTDLPAPEMNISISGLHPSTVYEISLWILFGEIRSEPIIRFIETAPAPSQQLDKPLVRSLREDSAPNKSLLISWTYVNNSEFYRVTLTNMKANETINEWQINTTHSQAGLPQVILPNLTENSTYRVLLGACHPAQCQNATYSFTTRFESLSTPKLHFVDMTNEGGVTLNWTQSEFPSWHNESVLLIAPKDPSIEYEICLQLASSSKLNANKSVECVWAKSFSSINLWTILSWPLVANLTKRSFSTPSSSTLNVSEFVLLFYVKSRSKRLWCEVSSHNNRDYCYTSVISQSLSKKLDDNTLQKLGLLAPPPPDSTTSSRVKWLLGVLLFVTVVIVLILAVVVYFIWRLRFRSRHKNSRFRMSNHYNVTNSREECSIFIRNGKHKSPRLGSSTSRLGNILFGGYRSDGSRSSDRPPSLSKLQSFEETPYVPIAVKDLAERVQVMHLDGNSGYLTEFEEINRSARSDWPMTVSQSAENSKRNRYSNISAFDHSRVNLQASIGRSKNDYINANFIDGYRRKAAFIATQGPMEHTCADFWQMIWEQQSNIIIMVSNFLERGRRKCDMYWSPQLNEARICGGVSVKLLEETELVYYTVRVFLIKATHKALLLNKKMEKERLVFHYQYTEWQDFDVPLSPLPVLTFVKHVMTHWSEQWGPIVVHCSAGVGRTGTLICIDALIRQMEAEQQVNVRGFLEHIRQQRMKLVQTEQQYAFIYDALKEYMLCPNHEVSIDNYSNYAPNMNGVTLENQFQLCVDYKAPPHVYAEASRPCNLAKNRSSIWPVEFCRVKLPGDISFDSSNYINASHIQGFYKKCSYIITQHPLSHTEEDFWRMVWDENSPVIIILSSMDMPVFWPQEKGETMEVGCLRIQSRGPVLLLTAADIAQCSHFKDKMVADASAELIVCHEFLLTSSREDFALVTRLCRLSHLWKVDPPVVPVGDEEVTVASVSSSSSSTPSSCPGDFSRTPDSLFMSAANCGILLHVIYALLPSCITQHQNNIGGQCKAQLQIPEVDSEVFENRCSEASTQAMGKTSIHELTYGLNGSNSGVFKMILVDDFGGSRAGCFAALSVLMQQCIFYRTVDVYFVMKMLHLQRPGMFSNSNDLGFMYQAMEHFLHCFVNKCKSNVTFQNYFQQLCDHLPSPSVKASSSLAAAPKRNTIRLPASLSFGLSSSSASQQHETTEPSSPAVAVAGTGVRVASPLLMPRPKRPKSKRPVSSAEFHRPPSTPLEIVRPLSSTDVPVRETNADFDMTSCSNDA